MAGRAHSGIDCKLLGRAALAVHGYHEGDKSGGLLQIIRRLDNLLSCVGIYFSETLDQAEKG